MNNELNMNNELMYRLETLLHAILNGGAEVGELLRENCDDFEDGDIVEEIETLYHVVKNNNEDYEEEGEMLFGRY